MKPISIALILTALVATMLSLSVITTEQKVAAQSDDCETFKTGQEFADAQPKYELLIVNETERFITAKLYHPTQRAPLATAAIEPGNTWQWGRPTDHYEVGPFYGVVINDRGHKDSRKRYTVDCLASIEKVPVIDSMDRTFDKTYYVIRWK